MAWLDLAVIAAYLSLVFAVNRYWASRVDFDGWLTSKGTIGWRFLMFTVVSTNVGAGTILGTAGSTYRAGIGWGLTSGVGALLGYWLMAAFAGRIRRYTNAGERSSFQEFFRRRYSRSVQAAVGVVIAFLYFFYLAAQFKGLGAIFEVWAGMETRVAGLVAALLVIWLTAGAGIRSDMYTDVLHFWAMVVTIAAACVIEIARLGGLGGLATALAAQPGGTAAALDPYAFGGASYVWMGILVGSFLGLPSMEVWQRVDAAKGERDARRAFFWAGVLNAAFFTAAVLLGLVARAALTGDIPKNQVLFRLLEHTLPPGLLGLAVVGAYAAFMSTANSMLMVAVAAILADLI
ncbi:MAG: sodium:solute symporter family protein, partial [bacterium]